MTRRAFTESEIDTLAASADDDRPDDFDPATLTDRFQLAGVRLVEIMLGAHPLTGEPA